MCLATAIDTINTAHLTSMYFEPLLEPDNYYKAFHKIKQISGWKDSVQRFNLNLSKNIKQLIHEVDTDTYQPDDFNVFTLSERGHIRLIKALSVRDSLLQHVLCINILIPNLRKYLIHDNGAGLTDLGLSFTRRRFEEHLHRYMREHGLDGYILLIDFQKFFDNVPHAPLVGSIYRRLPDLRLKRLLEVILKAHESDIS